MYFLSTGALSLSACLAQVAQVGYQQFLSWLQSRNFSRNAGPHSEILSMTAETSSVVFAIPAFFTRRRKVEEWLIFEPIIIIIIVYFRLKV